MFCPNCGSRVAPGSLNCATCGTKVANDMPPPPPPPPPGGSQQQPLAPVSYGQPLAPTGLSPRSKVVAGLLQIFLGAFGVGRFYTGHTTIAILQIVVTWVTCGVGVLWPFIDGILMLLGRVTDAEGRPLHD